MSPDARRGLYLVLCLLALMIAAAVGGYVFGGGS
jgi:hypothetical protein